MCDLAVSLRLPKIAHSSAGVPYCTHPPNTHTNIYCTHTPKCMKLIVHTVKSVCCWDQQEIRQEVGNFTFLQCVRIICGMFLPILDITCCVQAPQTRLNTWFLSFPITFLHFLPEFRASLNHVTANHLFNVHWCASAVKHHKLKNKNKNNSQLINCNIFIIANKILCQTEKSQTA